MTEEDRQVLIASYKAVVATPVVYVHGRWLNEMAREEHSRLIDNFAVRYGLPSPENDSDGDVIHYGAAVDGEFTKWDGCSDA